MDYVIKTIDGSMYLAHHGVKGQKWGVRRYLNKDGSLNDAGKKHYLKSDGKLNLKGKVRANVEFRKSQVANAVSTKGNSLSVTKNKRKRFEDADWDYSIGRNKGRGSLISRIKYLNKNGLRGGKTLLEKDHAAGNNGLEMGRKKAHETLNKVSSRNELAKNSSLAKKAAKNIDMGYDQLKRTRQLKYLDKTKKQDLRIARDDYKKTKKQQYKDYVNNFNANENNYAKTKKKIRNDYWNGVASNMR